MEQLLSKISFKKKTVKIYEVSTGCGAAAAVVIVVLLVNPLKYDFRHCLYLLCDNFFLLSSRYLFAFLSVNEDSSISFLFAIRSHLKTTKCYSVTVINLKKENL